MTLCKGCRHYDPVSLVASICRHPAARAQQDPVDGYAHPAGRIRCWMMRVSEACGPEAKLFEKRANRGESYVEKNC